MASSYGTGFTILNKIISGIKKSKWYNFKKPNAPHLSYSVYKKATVKYQKRRILKSHFKHFSTIIVIKSVKNVFNLC